jgi:asparagine synthase (glutamine-hydrolysing)
VGQTRLAIIDLITGDPPISTPDGAVGVALNGEIYNFGQLRDELIAAGHAFTTHGDTEVIAHLAEDLEPIELARRLDGMFAAAVWDERRGVLSLLRDRFGKKPLYWWRGHDIVVFASEIKALLAHPDVHVDLDPEALPALLHFGYVPSPRTCFQGVSSVPPGHVLSVGPDWNIALERYWEPPLLRRGDPGRLELPLDEAAAVVREALREAVRRRLVSDVPVGAFLSGGVDSSLIVALMSEVTSTPVQTFTIGFDGDDGFDERPWAAMVAQQLGTDHTEFVVHPDAIDLVERLVWHHDQPFGDSSAVPTWLLAEVTRSQVTVALAGDGGDEVFGGYERFSAGLAARWVDAVPGGGTALGAVTAAAARLVKVPPKARRFASVASSGLPDAYREWVAMTPSALVERLSNTDGGWARRDFHHTWDTSKGAPTLDRLLDLNLRTYLLDDLLPKVDRMAMAHGLEVRSPFLDHRVLDVAARLPSSQKAGLFRRKRVLRAAARGYVPDEVLDRPKKGFGVPLARWFREDLAAYVRGALVQPAARVRAHVDGGTLDRVLDEHARGSADHGDTLWILLTIEVFLRQRGW